MKRYSSDAGFALAALAVLGLAGPVTAGEKEHFKGRLEGDVAITPLAPPFVAVLVEGTGKANHLGKFTFAFPHIVNRATMTGIGTYHFTAANGDKLTADVTGLATPIGGGVLSIEETATITGGTGRFAGAKGHFIVERLFDTIAGTTAGTFKGKIRLRDDDDDGDDD